MCYPFGFFLGGEGGGGGAFPWGGGGGLKWGLARKMDILSDYGECLFNLLCCSFLFHNASSQFSDFFFFFFLFLVDWSNWLMSIACNKACSVSGWNGALGVQWRNIVCIEIRTRGLIRSLVDTWMLISR